MKIMFITSSLGRGGAERVVSVLANSFADMHHNVVIVLTSNNQVCYSISNQIRVLCLENQWNPKQKAFYRVFQRILAIRKTVKSEKPDVVISFLSFVNMETAMALMNYRVPLIVSERSNPAAVLTSQMNKLLRRIVYNRPDGFVFQTEEAKQYFGKQIQRKSTIILNPLVPNLPDYFSGERTKRIVSVGRLVKEKNYPLLLNAFEAFHKKRPEYILEIYGEGDQESIIKDIIINKQLSDCVKMLGFCNDVHEKINDASLFVMTSDYEGLPNSLIEAMALGLPCISTDCPCGGPRTLIENNYNGLLVKVGDAEELTRAMIDILDNPQYVGIGEKARNIRSLVNEHAITSQWIDYIDKVINRRREHND